MLYLTKTLIATIVTSSLFANPAYADLDDPLYKFLASDGADNAIFGESVGISGTIAIIGASQNSAQINYAGSAYIFDTTTGQQLFQLFPAVGTDEGLFGRSVAISGTKAIVGEPYGDSGDGAAYIFDATTGQQLFKLVPPVKSTGDDFGSSVAINGTIAIVGVPLDDDNGTRSGSAYLFDVTTGQQLFKLLPDDGAEEDRFGNAVAISGTRAIVGAFLNDDDGSNSGSAYIFDTTTGKQLAKLVPTDGEAGILFGKSVAIDGVRAVVGASSDNDNGIASGSAYIFDATTGEQLLKLLPKDGEQYEFFGVSVSISGTNVIAGAHSGGKSSVPGDAYMFDATNGQQLIKLIPINGAAGDSFGYAVAISGVSAIIGTPGDDDQGSDSGSAYITAVDTDRDGLLDAWENFGIDINGDGKVDLDLPAMGADPNHKDLFVEIDSMVGLGFNATAQANVIAAFANVPNSLVDNPDGLDGITLHLLVDETNIPVTPFPNNWVEFDVLKAARFGTATERANPNWANIKIAKMKAFRYCIFGHSHGAGSSSGMSELPGNDFMVTMGLWTTPGGTTDQQAGTFMHEFGHALKLRHGGSDNIHHKPNYYSVMNYTWQIPTTGYNAHWRLDYSRIALPNLDEAHLNENNGLGAPAGMFAGVMVPFGGGSPPIITYASMQGGTSVDFDGDGDSTDADTQVDVNYMFPSYQNPSYPEILAGYSDWPNLSYSMFGQDFADGVHNNTSQDTEMTVEIFEELDSIPPAPVVCTGDLDGDGSVGTTDLLELLAQWGTAGSADFDGSGVVGTNDLLILLANWGPCA